jgi:hypothetical protein
VWAVDLLYLDGKALRMSAQVLERLILRVRNGWIRRNFTDGPDLLAAGERMGL